MRHWLRRLSALLLAAAFLACGARAEGLPADFHRPAELAENDFTDEGARWCFARSAASEHFYLFWAPEFGDDPASEALPEAMRVDTADLLEKAEGFYDTNVRRLHMVDGLPGGYRLQIYLFWDEGWMATGSGYDDAVGALWISPMTCRPAGSVIAHEVGHCFQYLVGAEGKDGFRYGYAEGAGNAFWEVSAQWQSWQDYPAEMFTDYEMDTWFKNNHRALESEYTRYQNYWWLYDVAQRRGEETLAALWRESRRPEDVLSCYRRLYLDGDLDALYDELFDYACRAVTFDFDAARPYAGDWQGRYGAILYPDGEGWQRVAYASCPEANGFAAVALDAAGGERTLRIRFRGLEPGSPLAPGDPGRYCLGDEYIEENLTGRTRAYNACDAAPGWRYGTVMLLSDGTRRYGPCHRDREGTLRVDVPGDAVCVYLVVLGAPERYVCHVWDDDESTDAQMPFAIAVDG